MTRPFIPACALALIANAAPALANTAGVDTAGGWHVTGDVAGHPFALDCRFDPGTPHFGGACTDRSTSADAPVKAGKVYALSAGQVSGNAVSWSYPVKVFLMSMTITYAGTVAGDHMAGTVSIAGKSGKFTALRK